LVIRSVGFGGIVDNHCLNFSFQSKNAFNVYVGW